jgi:hypothetical protein
MIREREGLTVGLPAYAWWDPLRSDGRFAEVLRRLHS